MELGEVCRIPRPHEGLPGPLSQGKKVFSPSGETRGRAGNRTGCFLPITVMSAKSSKCNPHPRAPRIDYSRFWASTLLGRNKHTPASTSPVVLPSSEAGGNVLKDPPGPGGHPRPRPPWGVLPRNRDQEGRHSQSTRVPDQTLRTPCDSKAPGTEAPLGPSALSWCTLSQGRKIRGFTL